LGWKIFVIKNPKCLLKATFRRIIRKVILYCKFTPENSSLIWCSNWSFYFGLDICNVGLINYHFDAYLYRSRPTIWALFIALLHLLGYTHENFGIHFC
jgi:hypothetical protein